MSSPRQPATSRPTSAARGSGLMALIVDIVGILVFAIVGRSAHGEVNTLSGVLGTAWPFVIGALVGHLLCRLNSVLTREPFGSAAGGVIWICTVVIGLLLRILTGAGAAGAFALVATTVLGLLLQGWRVIVRLTSRFRKRAEQN